MSRQTVEERLAHLESRVAEVQAAKRPAKDWRRTIGAFTDDAGMREILRVAMRLRDHDRKKARTRKAKRKPRS